MSEVVVEQFEQNPWHIEAVQVTKENLLEIAKWLEATEFKVSYDLEGEAQSAKYHVGNDSYGSPDDLVPRPWRAIIVVKIGDYVIKGQNEDHLPTISGFPKEYVEKNYREGWS